LTEQTNRGSGSARRLVSTTTTTQQTNWTGPRRGREVWVWGVLAARNEGVHGRRTNTPNYSRAKRDPLPTKKSIDPSPGGSAPPAEGEAFAWRLPEPGRGPSVRHEIEEEEGREARRVGERIITEQAMSGAVIPNVLRVKCAKWQTEAERAIRIDAVAVALVPCLWLYHLLTDRWAPTPMHSISHVLHFSFLEKYIINIFKKKYSTKYRYL
jgi:hypothetical protein